MEDVVQEEIKTLVLDHHGLIAATCLDLGIAQKIDERFGKKDPRRVVSAGKAAVAMIINGLGFTNRRLYLTPQFFESKPVERLLGEKIEAEDLDDNALGKALDEIADYGASRLFGEISFEIALENNLLNEVAHLDTTSISVEGEYAEESEPGVMKLTYGYSKDHRPDLKQAILSLTVSGAASVPIWMEPLDGNSSDKKNFHETIKKVRDFQKQIKGCPEFKWIADSALYTKDKLLRQEGYLWLSRVPETIIEAKELLEKSDKKIRWKERAKGYKTASFFSKYGGVKQRWLLVYSQQGYDREKKTFERKLKEQEDTLEKALWHLSNQIFSCELDAGEAVKKAIKKYHYHRVEMDIVPIKSHQKRGRPRAGEASVIMGYQIRSKIRQDEEEIEKFLNRKGRFILATNDLDEDNFSDEKMLMEYKQQQEVERGFRFLKDPWFMVDSVFLKSPRRIEALMMIMTLCLMVYNVGQHRLRETLKKEGQMLPNQLNKPVQNPTLRWIFQIMEGVSVVQFYKDTIEEPIREFIANLNDLRKKIIGLFGDSACQIYGIS
jgi:transposase